MSNLYRSKNHFANLQMNVLYSSWGMELWTTVIIQSKKAKGSFSMEMALSQPMELYGKKIDWNQGGQLMCNGGQSPKGTWVVIQCSCFSSLVQSVSFIKCSIILQCKSSNPDYRNKILTMVFWNKTGQSCALFPHKKIKQL